VSVLIKAKSLKFLSLLFAGAIALSLFVSNGLALAPSPVSAQGSVPTAAAERSYPTEFPVAEPNYTSKRIRDFSPFAEALEQWPSGRRRYLEDRLHLQEITVPKMQELMAQGELTAEELVLYYIDRIQRYDLNQLNSVMELNPEALEIARDLDAERTAGNLWGPMHGIPVLLKDNIATGDQMHTTAGAYALKDWQADRDAQLVKNLRSSGAVILGKANLSEWANYLDPATPSGFTALGGQTRHPYGPFDPLGSSTGSAVSVAANFTVVSVGSETQGSIVRPASTNGVVGLKPSYGLVSGDYIIPLIEWMDVPGPIGRTVTDVATLLTALTHTDEGAEASPDPAIAALQEKDFTQFLDLDQARALKVGVPVVPDATIAEAEAFLADPPQEATPEQIASIQQALATFEFLNRPAVKAIAALTDMGIEVVELDVTKTIAPPDANQALQVSFKRSLNAFLASLPEPPVADLAEVIAINNADPANRIPYGQRHLEASQADETPPEAYAALQETNRTAAQTALDEVFASNDIDVLVSTTQAYAAAGYPALTVPSGLVETGEPDGILLIGQYLSEPDLLAVGYAIEQSLQAQLSPDLAATLATFEDLNQAVPNVQ
jgi:amidase